MLGVGHRGHSSDWRGLPRIAQQKAAPAGGLSTLTDPAGSSRYVGAKPNRWRLRLSVDRRNVARILLAVQFDHVALQVPDIAEALRWWCAAVPGAAILYADDSWGLLEAGGARLAFVTADQHPDHVAFKVSGAELRRLAAEHDGAVDEHRDGSRSFYLRAPGSHRVEVIAYPDALAEDAE